MLPKRENPIMKFSWNTIRSALLITLGLTMVIMGIAWAIDPLPATPAPAATAADPSASAVAIIPQAGAISTPPTSPMTPAPASAPAPTSPQTAASTPAPIVQAPIGIGTTPAATGLPSSAASPASNADTEVVETEITEEVDSPTQPGKKIKRKRKVRRRVKRRGKRGGKRAGMKFPKRKKSKGAQPLGMPRGKNPSQMTPQELLQRRNQLVRAQQKRALMRIQRQPMSNLAKLRARQMQQLPPGAKKYGSRRTVGMTPGKSGKSKGTRGKKGKGEKSSGASAQEAQAEATDTAAEQTDSSTAGDDSSAEPAPES